MAESVPRPSPLATDPQGHVWFATDTIGRLLSLDPRTDVVRVRGELPWRAVAVAFAADGTCHVVGNADREGKHRVARYRVEPTD